METPEQDVTTDIPTNDAPITSRSVARRIAIQTAPTETSSTPAPKTRTPSVKARPLSELDSMDAKKMTPAESVLYINALRELILKQRNQMDEMQKVTKSSFEQFRNADDSYHKTKAQYDADLALARQIINTAAKSIGLIGGQHA